MTINHKQWMFATAATAVIAAATPALAQTAAATPGNSLDEVVVTASRVVRNGFSAPTPVTVVGVEQLQARAAVNVADVLNESPAFRPTTTPQRSAIGGNFGANFVDLRGLEPKRTLVLVNGRRHVASTTQGEIDLNVIPTSLVERTEVVTGGASAAYGSDAVAGVVNLILKNKLQGVQGNIAYGTSDKADNNTYNASLAAGTAFAGGRGHVILGGEYDMNNGMPTALTARDWSSKLWGTLSLPATRAAGLPQMIVAPGFVYSNVMTRGGIIPSGPLANTAFGPGGTVYRFQPGPIVSGGNMFVGPSGDNGDLSFTTDLHVTNPVERAAVLGRVEFELTPHLNSFVEVGGGNTDQRSNSAGRLNQGNLTIRVDNAYLPAAVRAQMVALGLTSVPFGRFDSEIGRYKVHNQRATRRLAFGLNGDLGGGWTWDSYYQYGYNRNLQQFTNKVTTPNYNSAIDAVVGPTGAIVCRTNLAGADPGCVPYNVFGVGSPSQAAQDYVGVDTFNVTFTREQVAAANIRGEPFSVWAGPVSLAAGVEWRKESTKVKSDPYSNASVFDFGNEQPIPSVQTAYNFQGKVFSLPGTPYNASVPGSAGFNVKEIYAETVVPLAKDAGFIKSIDLNGAIRRTDYSLAGAVTTWKFGATFEDSSQQLRLRGTRSRDIRAPNLQETFGTAAVAIQNISDTPRGGAAVLTRVVTSGSTALTPEVADTFTYGGVFSPNFLPGIRASVDYYNIDIKRVITTIGGQNIVDRCARGATDLCSLIIRDGTGTITDVLNNQLNLNEFKTSGIDFEIDYRVPLDKMSVPGVLNLRGLATYTHDLITIDSAGPVDRVKQTVPQWVYNLGINYDLGRFSTNLTTRVLSRTTIDTTRIGPEDAGYSPTLSNSINRNRNPAVLYMNLSAQYTILQENMRKLVLYGVVNNLTDRDPPGAAGGNATAASLYDLVGRFIRVGARFTY